MREGSERKYMNGVSIGVVACVEEMEWGKTTVQGKTDVDTWTETVRTGTWGTT